MGTWKLNESKSKIPAGVPKNNTVVYAAAGDSIKVTIDGTAADGTATHNEWTGKFDGKDYPSTGNPAEDTRSIKQIDDRTLHVISKKGGKVVLTAHVVVAADGKSRTVTVNGTDAQGKKYTRTEVFDKQ
jgi:FlaG/FlaF family flagellin (archaellin)